MALQEKKEVCSKILITWMMQEQQGIDMINHDEEIAALFTSQIILHKFKVFDVDIVLPDMLLLMLNVCVDNNPGMFQIILKDLLNSIKMRKGPIPDGYVITTEDFSLCFLTDFPIIDISHIYKKYEKFWDAQKKETHEDFESDNLCDTPEWWKEVME